MSEQACTDNSREVWHSPDDMKSRSIRITDQEAVTICSHGLCVVLPFLDLHRLACRKPPVMEVEKVRRAIFNVLDGEPTANTGMVLAAVYEALGFPGIDYPPSASTPN